MSKPDKLPWIDPMQPHIFEVIVATAAEVRKQRKSAEYQQAERRIAEQERHKWEQREIERRRAEQEKRDIERTAQFILLEKAFVPL